MIPCLLLGVGSEHRIALRAFEERFYKVFSFLFLFLFHVFVSRSGEEVLLFIVIDCMVLLGFRFGQNLTLSFSFLFLLVLLD